MSVLKNWEKANAHQTAWFWSVTELVWSQLAYSNNFYSMELTVTIPNASTASYFGGDPHGINVCAQ